MKQRTSVFITRAHERTVTSPEVRVCQMRARARIFIFLPSTRRAPARARRWSLT